MTARVGDRFDPLAGPPSDELHAVLRQARAEEPVFYVPALDLWVVTRYDDMLTVVNDRDRFSVEGVLDSVVDYPPEVVAILAEGVPHDTPVLANTEGEASERLRASVYRSLTPRRVAALEPRIRELANRFVDRFAGRGTVDLFAEYAYPLPLTVILDFIGIPEDDVATIESWVSDWMLLQFSRLPADRQVDCARSVVAHHAYLRAFIADRRAAPRDDFASALIRAVDTGQADVSEDELVLLVGTTLTSAAHQAMSGLISATAYHLLATRSRWEEVREDRSLVPDVVEEVLRFDTPGGFFRQVLVDADLGGVTVPAGSRLLFYIPSCNRDDATFRDPDTFDVHRRDKSRHLAFSHGAHFCLGASFARAEARVALSVLLDRLPGLRLQPGQPLVYAPSVPMRRLDRLMVEWDVE